MYAIQTYDLYKKYKNQEVVSGVNMSVKQGSIYGLIGRNGAGKTTLMKLILGLTATDSGEIRLWGQKLENNDKRLYPRIGTLMDFQSFYPNLTGYENLKVLSKLKGLTNENAIKSALIKLGLDPSDKKVFNEYSLGMKKRLGLANAIVHEPELLILDEPTNGLDPLGITELRKYLIEISQARGITILISSHILSEVSIIANDIGILEKGKLIMEKSMQQIQKENKTYIKISVDNVHKSCYLLEKELNIKDYQVIDNSTILIYDLNIERSKMNKVLVSNDVNLISLEVNDVNLEDIFKNLLATKNE